MKLFDGFEEIEILPWYECEDCTKHSYFPGLSSAQVFLQRFRICDVAIDSLRRLVTERREGQGLQIPNDYQVLDQVAQMLITRELHLTRKRPILGTGATAPKKEATQPRVQAAPEPIRRPAAEPPPPPPPEEPVFLPNVDPVAMAQVLTHAAQSGVPFCEE